MVVYSKTAKKVPKWKQQSSQLRDAMRAGRALKKAMDAGVPLNELPPAPTNITVDDR